MRHRHCLSLLLGLLVVARAAPGDEVPHVHPGDAMKLGTVVFPVSCSPAAQEVFGRAVALIHSFWYDEAEKAFGEVAALDPTCAMAYWGIAMSNFHPIWAPPTPAELERGQKAVARAESLPIPTQRERGFIAAIGAYYRDAATRDHVTRKLAFEAGMEKVHTENPQDREAAIFHALALLGAAPANDKTYGKQKEAGAILNEVLPGAEDHPGVAHYLIHSFDYPQLATIGLPAARVYANIAASSPHALHMPSHIFTRLGLWDESIASNIASRDAALAHVKRTKPGYASFDQLHALDYLAYAYLQQARDGEAKRVLDEVAAVDKLDLPNFAAAYALAAVPARYALERRDWAGAAALTVRPTSFPWATYPYAEALVHFARAVGGARGANLVAARDGLTRLTEIKAALVLANDPFWAGQVEIQRLAAQGWIARAEGKSNEARLLLGAAADLEDTTDKHPVTPGSVLPAREMLADLLLESGEPAAALRQYETSLATVPGRFGSLAGGIRAADQAGDRTKAADLFAALQTLSAKGDGSRAELLALRTAHRQKPD